MKDLNHKTALILNELFAFDGLTELCIMSEMEGEFGLSADTMISTLRTFIDENI